MKDRSTETGALINNFLTKKLEFNSEVIHLLYSANRWEKKEQITEILNSGTHIIMDRYCYSGVAYSMAKGVDMEWCKNSDKGLPAPDILFFLDISPEEAQKRKGFGDERYEVNEFQAKVNLAYSKLRDDSWTVINVDGRSVEEITDNLTNIIDDYLVNHSSLPIKTLW